MVTDSWREAALGAVATLQRGFDLPHRARRIGDIPVVTSSGIGGAHNEARVSGPGVVTGRYGTIGEVFYIQDEFWPLNTTLFVKDFHGNDPLFISYLLRTIDFQSHSGKSGVPGVNRNDLHKERVRVPDSVAEQRAIAAALSDIDSVLDAQAGSINKKCGIRQAVLQQLLTGQTRLAGFNGEWEAKSLGAVAHIKTGSRNNEDKVEGGRHPLFVRSATVERIDSYAYDEEAILVPGEGGIGSIFHYVDGRFDVHQRVYKISDFSPGVVGKFVYYSMIQHFAAHAMRHSVKATVDSLRLPTFQNFQFAMPGSQGEQRAIVTALSDIDAEIEALEARLAKTRDLKGAMAQELLTGRARLV